MSRFLKTVAVAAAIAMGVSGASAGSYPDRTIELIFPWGPGTSMSLSQLLADAMGKELGVSVTTIATPGAAGTKAFKTAMGKPADGYTIYDGYVAPLVLQPVLGKAKWSYKDFVPLHAAFSNAFSIGVNAHQTRWKTFQDMMSYCKAHPGELRYTTGFRDNLPHMVIAKVLMGYDCVAQNIPYKTNADAAADIKSGLLDFGYVNVGTYQQDPDAFKIMLVLSELPQSKEAFNNAPSIADLNLDLGLSGLAPMGWDWWLVSKDTPPDRVAALRKAMNAALERPDIQQKVKSLGFVPLPWGPEDYDKVVGPVAGQMQQMRNALAWEETQLAKLK